MRRFIFVLLILLILILAWLIWTQSNSEPASKLATANISPSAPSNSWTPPPPVTPASPQDFESPKPMDSRMRDYLEHQREDRQWDWKRPISFYGKVIDQDERPVEGANAHLAWNDTSIRGTTETDTLSDENGLFSLTGVKGKILIVRVSKEGYYTPVKEAVSGFEYADFTNSRFYQPDRGHPVIFHLKKKENADPLIHWQKLCLFSIDGTPGHINSLGMVVSIIRGFVARTDMGPRFDWSVTLTIPNGGFIESNDEFMFTAPETGYAQAITLGEKASDVPFNDDVTKQYYIKTQNGKVYGRVKFDIYPRYNDNAAIDVEAWINPAPGHRNLEFEPAKQISR